MESGPLPLEPRARFLPCDKNPTQHLFMEVVEILEGWPHRTLGPAAPRHRRLHSRNVEGRTLFLAHAFEGGDKRHDPPHTGEVVLFHRPL